MKARMTITVTIEYDIHPEHYPEGATTEGMLAIDIASANEDPYSFLDMDAGWVITAEVIE